jgi:acetyl esterase/lipase
MCPVVHLLASIAAIAVSAVSAPQPVVEHGVPFAARGGAVLRMDIHRPATRTAGRLPAIVWMHGGGFHTGTRGQMTPYADFFARRGYVAATIDYRLQRHAYIRRLGYGAGEAAAREDAEAAIASLRRRAVALHIDPARIVVAGASAGAVTALNVATVPSHPARVRAAVSLAGYGHPEAVDPGDPPLLMVHGDADLAIPFDRARRTCAAAAAAGVRCDLVRLRGAGHRSLLADVLGNARRVAAWLRALGVG